MEVYWGALYVQIHGKYKDKTKQKPPEVEEAREGNGQPGQQLATTAVGTTTARPWQPLPWWLLGCPQTPRFGLLGSSPWAAGFCLSWDILGLFLVSSFDPHGPYFISLDSSQTFSPKSWLES